jgi:hypothetical protein
MLGYANQKKVDSRSNFQGRWETTSQPKNMTETTVTLQARNTIMSLTPRHKMLVCRFLFEQSLLGADRASDLSTTFATHSVSNPVLVERNPNFL